MACNLPWEGEERGLSHLGDIAQDIPTCGLDDTARNIRDRLKESTWRDCVVLDKHGVVLGLVPRARVEEETGKTAEALMDPAPVTFRPHRLETDAVDYMQEHDLPLLLVTTADGTLIGGVSRQQSSVVAPSRSSP